MNTTISILQKNLASIQQQISDACQRSGRTPEDVQIIAVTKYADWSWVQDLSQLHNVFGENRPQQLAERQVLLPQIHWHLIGQLQRNKVRLTLHHAAMIHSVDSLRLLEAICAAAAADQESTPPSILLQVNMSGEASKSGFAPAELPAIWPDVLRLCCGLRLCGLMTMAAECDTPESARPTFQGLRLLRDSLQNRDDTRDAGITLTELSMGMSGDFVPAVEEGATLVRIGSRLFEGLQTPH